MTVLHAISTLVLALIGAGVATRRHPSIHIRFMGAAFAIDLALALWIELSRHAVERVAGPAGPLVWFHAGVSTLVLALYVAQLRLGRRLLAGQSASRRVHIAIGLTFCLCRGLNYVTAFAITPQAALLAPQTALLNAPAPPAIDKE
ncbi:MAG: hypothetical protein R2745_10460 [Vicinamibacterales bacterium]